MGNFITLSDEIKNKILNTEVCEKSRIPFGEGKIMPVNIEYGDTVGIIICYNPNGEKEKLGKIIKAGEGAKIAETAVPMTYLSFPKNADGLTALKAVKEWLEIVEEIYFKEERK